jgi:uncharacterized Ntn-hydrolase superfamily protein
MIFRTVRVDRWRVLAAAFEPTLSVSSARRRRTVTGPNRLALTSILVVLLSVASRQAGATWSIVAVDPITREVGAAAATCTVGVELIYGGVPGRGVIVAQAATNLSARRRGVEMIAAGAGPREIISLLASEEFNPGGLWNASWREQQYGVAVLGAGPAAGHFTGVETVPWSGGLAEGTVSVQGNMLYSRDVVDAAFRSFRESGRSENCTPHLAERLIRALEAGATRGGDKRCPRARAALTAFVAVADPEDPAETPSLFLVAPRAFGVLGSIRHRLFPYSPSAETPPPVTELRARYEEWLRSQAKRKRSSCGNGGFQPSPAKASWPRNKAPKPAWHGAFQSIRGTVWR